jgi:hypothetical protein
MAISSQRRAINFVGRYNFDELRGNVSQKLVDPWMLHTASREAALIIGRWDGLPSLVLLADDIGFAGLPLGAQQVKVLFQPILAGFRV